MIYTTLDNEEAFCQRNIDGQYNLNQHDNTNRQYGRTIQWESTIWSTNRNVTVIKSH